LPFACSPGALVPCCPQRKSKGGVCILNYLLVGRLVGWPKAKNKKRTTFARSLSTFALVAWLGGWPYGLPTYQPIGYNSERNFVLFF